MDISTQGQQDFNIPYSALVPLGETRDLHITHSSVGILGPQVTNAGASFLKVEAPADSGNWKLLCHAVDGAEGGKCANSFTTAIIMSSADEICMTVTHFAYPPGISWSGPNSSWRNVVAFIQYTIGP